MHGTVPLHSARLVAAALAVSALAAAVTGPAASAGSAAGPVIVDAWARTSPAGAVMGAAYFTVKAGPTADTLTAVAVAPAVAMRAELHRSSTSDHGMTGMTQVRSIRIPAHGTLVLKPGGYHVMLVRLAKPLRTGKRFTLTLTFARAGTRVVSAVVRPS